MVGIQPGLGGGFQYTTTGSSLPACGTMTMPTPARKRESRVRASCMRPQTARSRYSRQTSPAKALNRSEEHTSELQSREKNECRILLEKKKKNKNKCSNL